MNVRTLAILAVLLVVLAGVATLMEKNKKKEWRPTGEMLFPSYEQGEADGIFLKKGNIEVELARSGSDWVVVSEESKPADPKLVGNILDNIDNLKGDDQVAATSARHADLEVDSTGVEVRVSKGGDDTAWFIVGKPGSDFMSTYIRPAEDDAVFRVPVYLRSFVDRGEQTWRNKTLLELDEAEIASYRTVTDSLTVRVEQDETGAWQITEPIASPTRSDVMGIVVRSLASIKASGFADTLATAADGGLDDPERILEIETRGGTKYSIEIGDENPARQTYTRLAGSDQIFLVPVGRWNTVFRNLIEIQSVEAITATEGEATDG